MSEPVDLMAKLQESLKGALADRGHTDRRPEMKGTADSHPPVYQTDDGMIHYRASGLGACDRALIAARQGYEALPPTAKMQEVFDAGSEAESRAVKLLAKNGVRVVGAQREIALNLTDKIRVVGHIDGFHISDGALKAVIEIKSQSHKMYSAHKDWESGLFPKYKWQVSVYMLATGLPLLMVRMDRDDGTLNMETVTEPFYTRDQITERVLDIEAQARRGVLDECDKSMYPCPFYYLHEDDREQVDDRGLEVILNQYQDTKRLLDTAKEKNRVSRDALLGRLGAGKHQVGRWRVTVWQQAGPSRLDVDRAVADIPELSQYLVQSPPTPRIKVTEGDNG